MADWVDDLRVGDVLARPNGPWRIVRAVSRQTRSRIYVTFAIRRCSWTGRGLTVYLAHELVRLGYRRVARNAKMLSDLDQRLARDAHASGYEYCVGCHETVGIA